MRRVATIISMMLAIVCAIYGLCIMALRSGSRFYLIWILIAMFLAALSVVMRCGLLRGMPTGLLAALGVAIITGLAIVVVTSAMMLSRFHAAGENDPNVIIVLGAQVRIEGPSRILRYRLDTAYDYLVTHPEVACIVSGGQGSNEPEPEAESMARYLTSRGIDSERILIENQSENTVQNLQLSASLLDPAADRVAVVTNNFHIYRSLALARGAGYQNVSGIAAPSDLFYLPNNMLRETCGLLKDWLAGNL